jgi:uncharacterized Zn finger protein
MSYYGYPPYVPVAERRKKAERAAAKAKKSGTAMNGVAAFRGAIAKTVWGKAWCANLEHYGDFANRLPRGRTYVRSGAVIDLRLSGGDVVSKVMGSHLYTVKVRVAKVQTTLWRSMSADCSSSISSLVELLQGRLSSAVMERMCRQHDGLFPAPKELIFDCSCPDGANLCKHVAATLYGIGARLDHRPELLFALRGVDPSQLVAQATAGLASTEKKASTNRVLDDASISDVFGLEMHESVAASDAPVILKPTPKPKSKPKPSAKRATTSAVKAPMPTVATAQPASDKSAKIAAKVAAKSSVSPTAKMVAKRKQKAPKKAAETTVVAIKTPTLVPPKTTRKAAAKTATVVPPIVPSSKRKIRTTRVA